MPYGVYKGRLDEASTVVEAWLKKKKRTPGSMSAPWRTVDFRFKARVRPDGASEPVVVANMPDHVLKPDVAAVVRHAMLSKSVAGAVDAPVIRAQKYPFWVRLAEHYPGNGPK